MSNYTVADIPQYRMVWCGNELSPERVFDGDNNWVKFCDMKAACEWINAYIDLLDSKEAHLRGLSQKHTAILAAIDEVIAQNGLTLLAKEQLTKARNVT